MAVEVLYSPIKHKADAFAQDKGWAAHPHGYEKQDGEIVRLATHADMLRGLEVSRLYLLEPASGMLPCRYTRRDHEDIHD